MYLDGVSFGLIGPKVDLTFPYEVLGEGPEAIEKLLSGGPFLDKLRKAERPAVLVGPGIFQRTDRPAVLKLVGLFPQQLRRHFSIAPGRPAVLKMVRSIWLYVTFPSHRSSGCAQIGGVFLAVRQLSIPPTVLKWWGLSGWAGINGAKKRNVW